GGRIDPDAAGCSHPDVAALIAFHAIGHARLQLGANAARQNPRIDERTAGFDIEGADQRLHGVIDIERALVGREAEPVWLLEQIAVDQHCGPAAAAREAIDALKAELARSFDTVDWHAAVPWIAEIDRAARMHANVV